MASSMTQEPADIDQRCAAIAARHDNRPDSLIEILHEVQGEVGYVPESALPAIADALNLSRAEVHGVVTFYHDFRREPAARHMVQVCGAEACQSMGCRDLVAHVTRRLGTDIGETSPDGTWTLREVFCLGNCALSPAVMIDGRLHGRVDAGRFDALLADLHTEASP